MQIGRLLKTWRPQGSTVLAELFGGLVLNGPIGSDLNTLTFGASIAIDASLGNAFTVSATSGAAFAFAAPTNPPPTGVSQELAITVKNASGGVLGAGTFNAVFKVSGNVPAIANGFNRTIGFRWDGTNWIEVWRGATDVPN